jgi:hypothetical protein
MPSMQQIKYELAVVHQDGDRTKMDLKSYPSREAAIDMRRSLVAGFQKTGYTIVEGSEQVDRIVLRLNADQQLAEFGLVAPSVVRPSVELLIRPTGIIGEVK